MSDANRPALLYFHSVDDLFTLARLCGDLGLRLVASGKASEILREVREGCQFVLLDLDGEPHWHATLQELQQAAPQTEVVVYTRCPETQLWLDALEAGAFDLLCKPFSRNELEWVLENLRRRRQRPAEAPPGKAARSTGQAPLHQRAQRAAR
jgi:DNA-binding response OmpR family regulator